MSTRVWDVMFPFRGWDIASRVVLDDGNPCEVRSVGLADHDPTECQCTDEFGNWACAHHGGAIASDGAIDEDHPLYEEVVKEALDAADYQIADFRNYLQTGW